MPEWVWLDSSHRYHDLTSGRFISGEQVRDWSHAAADASGDAATEFARMLEGGQLNLGDWQTVMREEIKKEYVRQYLLGRGGLDKMTQQDWGSVGGMLRETYTYLDRFARDIASGRLSVGQISRRSRMYTNSAREAYERARRRVNALAEEMRWVINSLVENCEDCLAFQAMGWRMIADRPYSGAIPGSGQTRCLTNCACHIEYR